MPSRAELSATVRRLFAAAGDLVHPATLSRATPADYDPETGAPAAPETAETACSALFDHAVRPRFDLLDGIEIADGEIVVWLSGAGFAPQGGDRLAIDGTVRAVRAVRDVLGAGALYLVIAR